MRYELSFSKTESGTSNAWGCRSIREAAQRAYWGLSAAGYSLDYVTAIGSDEDDDAESVGVIGACESCDCVILEGDHYGEDEEGIRVCDKCMALERKG